MIIKIIDDNNKFWLLNTDKILYIGSFNERYSIFFTHKVIINISSKEFDQLMNYLFPIKKNG